jgi:hypothetical protein
MTLDKVQLVAIAVVSSTYKIQWLIWWNLKTLTHEALRFLANSFLEKEFKAWLNKASLGQG